MNDGERNELLIKLMLVWLRGNDTDVNLGPFDTIDTVGFPPKEYRPLPSGFDITSLRGINDTALSGLTKALGITKASTFFKSDVYINGDGYSVKSFSSAPPALVNHTARPGFEFACNHSGADIHELDAIIERYWELRISNQIKEDIKNIDPLSPFRTERTFFTPLLLYFLFEGSGSKVSPHPADYILDYDDPLDVTTWRLLDRTNAISSIWDRLIFSLRSTKGMPVDYPDNNNSENNDSIAIWTRFFQNKHRGALHIRASK